MKAPLKVEYDYDPDHGTDVYLVDADGQQIIDALGPEGTPEDLQALADAYNALHQTTDLDRESRGQAVLFA